jgi:hypothetical protein
MNDPSGKALSVSGTEFFRISEPKADDSPKRC